MYIARAKIVFADDSTISGSAILNKVELQINGLTVETAIHSQLISTSTGQLTFEYEFKNIGHKVAATQIIKLEVITLDPDVTVEGFIECFGETTGESPFQSTEFA